MHSTGNNPQSLDSKKRREVKVRFERHASQVVFDPASSAFVVTWAKCNVPLDGRLAKRAPGNWMPSIAAMTTLFDRGCIGREQIVYAAKAIGAAWKAGDRDCLDTDSAKKAAELVCDISSMCVDTSSPSASADMGQAIRHLLDEIAAVRFSGTPISMFDRGAVMPLLEKAAAECLAIDGFADWPDIAKRRRFLFCLNRRERTEVAYSLVALLFNTGPCSLLSVTDRRVLRMRAARVSGIGLKLCAESISTFFGFVLDVMHGMRESDLVHVPGALSASDIVDIAKGSSDGAESPTQPNC